MESKFVTVNGKNHYIRSTDQAIDLIRDNMGYDVAELIYSLSLETEPAKEYAKLKIDTDIDACESELEYNASAFRDMSDIISEFENKIEDRKMISVKDVDVMLKNLNNILKNMF